MMTKTHVSVAIAMACLLGGGIMLGIQLWVEEPEHLLSAHLLIADRPDVDELCREYKSITWGLRQITVEDIHDLLGDPIIAPAKGLALPVFAPPYAHDTAHLGTPGPDHSHVEAFPIGHSGVIMAYVARDGKSIWGTLLFHRKDEEFVPLHGDSDLERRLVWDAMRFKDVSRSFPWSDLGHLISERYRHHGVEMGQQKAAGDSTSGTPEP